jgi:hypothetical protein
MTRSDVRGPVSRLLGLSGLRPARYILLGVRSFAVLGSRPGSFGAGTGCQGHEVDLVCHEGVTPWKGVTPWTFRGPVCS